MKILGLIFDQKLSWSDHITKAIAKTKSVCYGLQRLKATQTTENLLTLATSLAFSKLYYAAPVWLNRNLHSLAKQNLLRASTNILKSCFRQGDWNYVSFKDIHEIAGIATPIMYSDYCHVTTLKRIIETCHPETVWNRLQHNCIELRRENRIFFTNGSQTPMGLNNFANRVQFTSSKLTSNWDSLSTWAFKRLAKQLFLKW